MSQPRDKEFWNLVCGGNLEELRHLLDRVLQQEGADSLRVLLNKKFGQFKCKLTALHKAVDEGYTNIVELLLKKGADIHITDYHSRTALHIASEQEDIRIIDLILKCPGVKVNAVEEYGNTAIKLAAEKGYFNNVRLLIEKGADVNKADNVDNTTLHVAAKEGHEQVLALLLKNVTKGTVGKQNKDKNTPLHLAAENKSPICVALLLDSGAGASLEVKNEQGRTPLGLANENKRITDLLENPEKAAKCLEKPRLGMGGSVESDSPPNDPTHQTTLSATGIPQGIIPLPSNGSHPVNVIAEKVVFNQNYGVTVNNGNVAVGPQVIIPQPGGANALPQPIKAGDSHYNVDVRGGNAIVGDYGMMNLGAGTSRTPSTAGSSDVPFFPESLENRDPPETSSGAPTENPDSLGPSEALPPPVPEESPGDNASGALSNPIQEESPPGKDNQSLLHPVQEEFPGDKPNGALSYPVQEEAPPGKGNQSFYPVQEESPGGKANGNLSHPVQEKSSPGKDSKSLTQPVQEESPNDKADIPNPVQEEAPADKSYGSLPHPVKEQCPTNKADVPTTTTATIFSSGEQHSVPEERPVREPNTSANSFRSGEELDRRTSQSSTTSQTKGVNDSGSARSSTEERATKTVTSANSGSLNETGAYKPTSSTITWQNNLGIKSPRRPLTRSVAKDVQDRILKEVNNPPASETIGLEQRCVQPGSQNLQATSGEGKFPGEKQQRAEGDTTLPRASLRKSPGPPLVLMTRLEPTLWEPGVPVGGAASGLNNSSANTLPGSSSREAPHRTERHSRDDSAADTVKSDHASTRSAGNGVASRSDDHVRDEHRAVSGDNLSSATNSSANGNSSSGNVKDEKPEDDEKGQENCNDTCKVM